ncbi:MAG: SPOR domain-containing protein [Saprospiraceae bacterium]|nr:SPOR domain-containing protein [Saprospiraceae bacterium]
MNRLLSILVSLFVLFLIYLWINHIMTSTPRSQIENRTTARMIDEAEQEALQEKYDLSENAPVEPPASSESTDRDDPPIGESTPAASSGSPAETSEPAPEKEAEAPAQPPPPASGAESPDGIHLVIAGNFLERANAEKRAKHLRDNGFVNAEVVNFQLSQFHTVCAGRYNDLGEARRMAKKLKDFHSIDAYVRNGN